jgi:hypothetical protein
MSDFHISFGLIGCISSIKKTQILEALIRVSICGISVLFADGVNLLFGDFSILCASSTNKTSIAFSSQSAGTKEFKLVNSFFQSLHLGN